MDYSKEFENIEPKPMEQIEIPKVKEEIKFIKVGEKMKNLIDGITDWKTTIPAVISGASWIIGKVWGIELPQTEITTACFFVVALFVNTKK